MNKPEFKISDFDYENGKQNIEVGVAQNSIIEVDGLKSLKMEIVSVGDFDVYALFEAFAEGKKIKIEIVND